MSLFSDIKAAFSEREPQGIGQLSAGLCVLPMPKTRTATPKTKDAADLYVIDEPQRVFGFNFATAQKHENGGVPELTGYDIDLLRERDYWGNPKAKALHAKNAACKRCWHSGDTETEAGAKLGKSESWIEKRYGTFATALSQEVAESENPAQTVAEKS